MGFIWRERGKNIDKLGRMFEEEREEKKEETDFLIMQQQKKVD